LFSNSEDLNQFSITQGMGNVQFDCFFKSNFQKLMMILNLH